MTNYNDEYTRSQCEIAKSHYFTLLMEVQYYWVKPPSNVKDAERIYKSYMEFRNRYVFRNDCNKLVVKKAKMSQITLDAYKEFMELRLALRYEVLEKLARYNQGLQVLKKLKLVDNEMVSKVINFFPKELTEMLKDYKFYEVISIFEELNCKVKIMHAKLDLMSCMIARFADFSNVSEVDKLQAVVKMFRKKVDAREEVVLAVLSLESCSNKDDACLYVARQMEILNEDLKDDEGTTDYL